MVTLAGAVLWERGVRDGGATSSVAFPGSDLRLSGASGRAADSSLLVRDVPRGGRATALVTGLDLSALDYGSVEVELGAPRRDVRLLFLWATKAAPATILGAPLAWGSGATATLRLEGQEPWQGTVGMVGIGIVGPLPTPLAVRGLRLNPRSGAGFLASVWHEWTAFEGLDAHSPNFVIGGSDQARPLVRPVPAAAAWAGLALVLHVGARALRRRAPDPRVLSGLVLAAWLVLDARWQVDLWRQLELTRERYAGKSWLAKRLAAEDADLFRFCLAVKARLPSTPQVVYLLARDPERADRYVQLRGRYHLLPHNVCSYYSVPPEAVEPGEYVLVFGQRPDLAYDDAAGTLRSEAGFREIPVERILTDRLGTLYRRR